MVQQLWSKFYWHNEFIYADQQPHIHNAMQTEFMYAALFSYFKTSAQTAFCGRWWLKLWTHSLGKIAYTPTTYHKQLLN